MNRRPIFRQGRPAPGRHPWGLALLAGSMAFAAPAGPRLDPTQSGQSSCTECHQTTAVRSHPIGVRPTMRVPADLPLESGLLACTTCHEPDPCDPNSGRSGGAVRRTSGNGGLCVRCHERGGLDVESAHAAALGLAHPQTPRAGPSATPARVAASELCLQCHDGSITPDDPIMFRTGRREAAAAHPVGVPYPTSGRSGRSVDERLAPIATLDPRIELPGGVLACSSCHSLYSTEPKLLVMRNTASRLCLSCHAER